MIWEFGTEGLFNSTNEELEEGVLSVIIINNVTLSDRGNYTCCARNSEGTQKDTVELIVTGINMNISVHRLCLS